MVAEETAGASIRIAGNRRHVDAERILEGVRMRPARLDGRDICRHVARSSVLTPKQQVVHKRPRLGIEQRHLIAMHQAQTSAVDLEQVGNRQGMRLSNGEQMPIERTTKIAARDTAVGIRSDTATEFGQAFAQPRWEIVAEREAEDVVGVFVEHDLELEQVSAGTASHGRDHVGAHGVAEVVARHVVSSSPISISGLVWPKHRAVSKQDHERSGRSEMRRGENVRQSHERTPEHLEFHQRLSKRRLRRVTDRGEVRRRHPSPATVGAVRHKGLRRRGRLRDRVAQTAVGERHNLQGHNQDHYAGERWQSHGRGRYHGVGPDTITTRVGWCEHSRRADQQPRRVV
jgi:hypothetical protein